MSEQQEGLVAGLAAAIESDVASYDKYGHQHAKWSAVSPTAAARRVLERFVVIPISELPEVSFPVPGHPNWARAGNTDYAADTPASARWNYVRERIAIARWAEEREGAAADEREEGIEALAYLALDEGRNNYASVSSVRAALGVLYDAGVRAP